MKNEFAQMIRESVHDVFLAFLFIEVTPGPMITKRDEDLYRPPDTEVTAIINFSGGVHGGIHLASPLHVAVNLSSTFAGEAFDSIDGESGDGFGELTNMIAGGVQTKLSEKYGNINLTPPTIISGDDYKMQYKTNFDSVKQYFKSQAGPFYVDFFFYVEGYCEDSTRITP